MNQHQTGVLAPLRRRRRVASTPYGAGTRRQGITPRGSAGTRPNATAARIRSFARAGDDGFTLVELLVVVLMLVALVGIAVPTFVGQQARAERAAVQSELRTAAIALESFRARNGVYGIAALATPEFGFVRSLDVATFFESADFDSDGFCVRAWYDAVAPGAVRQLTAAIANDDAEWAITETGLVYLGDKPAGSRSCP